MKFKLKSTSIILLSLVYFQSEAQRIEIINQNLVQSYSRIAYWYEHSDMDEYDSLGTANDNFEKLLLEYTSSSAATINHNFKSLADSGLNMQTSPDGLFRIYSWDDMSGGTQRYFRNVYQYQSGNKIYSKVLRTVSSIDDEQDIGCNYFPINEVTSNGITYYITRSGSKAATLLYIYTVKIFSIENARLNDTAKLIMNKSGLHNGFSYEVDWTSLVNRNNNTSMETDQPVYDQETKVISIPLIQEDGKVTAKRIRYKFNGQYFIKL